MDTKKIGEFLKVLRKERGLTQEQLAEVLLVSGRTVSRWETGTNMPDLSILIQIAEFYDIEIKEILSGERKSEIMEKELKETLVKVADYSKMEKEKATKAGNIAFGVVFIVCAVMILIQMILTKELRFVIGETVALLIGGIIYIGIMVYNGTWENGFNEKRSPFRDALISIVCSGVFTVALVLCYIRLDASSSQIVNVASLFFVGICLVGFVVLRLLTFCSRKMKHKKETFDDCKIANEKKPVNVFVADGNMQADMIIELLKQNNIMAYKQDLGDAGFAAVRYGMGRGIDDRVAIFVAYEKVDLALEILNGMGLD